MKYKLVYALRLNFLNAINFYGLFCHVLFFEVCIIYLQFIE